MKQMEHRMDIVLHRAQVDIVVVTLLKEHVTVLRPSVNHQGTGCLMRFMMRRMKWNFQMN